MKRWTFRFIYLASFLAGSRINAETISWFSDANEINLDGSGAPMGSGFHFELGVFSGGFVPTRQNSIQWATHWVAADSTAYNPTTRRFADLFAVAHNHNPFLQGTHAWIFGRRVSATGTEMILLRNSGWIWPAPDPMNPIPLDWNVATADQVVMGELNAGGAPFLMKSANVRTFTQWQAEHLAGEPLAGSEDDPDKDGSSNLLEFIFDTAPMTANPPSATPVTLAGGHMQIAIPRRADRPALITVEVSGNLADWQSGPTATQIVGDGMEILVVRDLAPLGSSHPKRFMRLKAEPAAP